MKLKKKFYEKKQKIILETGAVVYLKSIDFKRILS